MRIAVCVRMGADGAPGPFEASAYELALSVKGAEVILASMGPPAAYDMLSSLTRLGAREAFLLSDKAFAGADTLATAYTLALMMRRLEPDLIFCGRQTLIGDTGQTPPMLAAFLGYRLVNGVLTLSGDTAITRSGEEKIDAMSVLTVEKQAVLRLPSLRSKAAEPTVIGAAELGADIGRCGIAGSPTRVLGTSENKKGRRHCRFIATEDLKETIKNELSRRLTVAEAETKSEARLGKVIAIGRAPLEYAKKLCDTPEVLESFDEDTIVSEIAKKAPDALLFGNDAGAKALAAHIAARLGLGLCADCTAVGCEDGRAVFYRPALSGSLIAKVVSLTRPALATVRCKAEDENMTIVAAGYGVRDDLASVRAFANELSAGLAVSRRLVDAGYAPYSLQAGLTGRTLSPRVYIAVGISGAVHHIVGMDRSGCVIAVNPDRNAPIFDYADYGIVCEFNEIKKEFRLC